MSRVKIIGDRSGRVWPLVLCAAEESRQAGRKMILYVPEQMTLQTERDLILGLGLPGLLETQVISPRKLVMQVREQAGTGVRQPLSEPGRAMAVHRVMTEKEDELAYYGGMTELPGAVKRVNTALNELRESGMTPEELDAYAADAPTGAERTKLHDLKTIWNGYEALISEQFEDEKTAWTDMVTRLEKSRLWDGIDLAVYGFDTIRPDLRELLAHTGNQVHSARIFLVMDAETAPDGRIFSQQWESVDRLTMALEEKGIAAEEILPHTERKDCAEALAFLDRNLFALCPEHRDGDPGDALTLYAGSTPWDEAEKISETLRKWKAEGVPWNGMMIALPPGDTAAGMLRANMKLNGIPFLWEPGEPATEHPVCRMLLCALKCLSDGYSTEDVVTIARSGCCTLTREEGTALADYARAHGIEDSLWQRPFTAGENAWEAEALRLRLLTPLEEMRTALKAAGNAEESVMAVANFLDTEAVWESLQADEEQLLDHVMYRTAVINHRVWKLLPEILSQLKALLGNRRATIRDMRHMLESALAAVTLVSLPEEEKGVVIGEIGHLLADTAEALILPRAQDGLMAVPESGWLTDPERRKLEEGTGKIVGISREAGIQIRKYDIYRALTLPRKKLMISWSLRAESGGALQPDGLITQIRELFPDLKPEGGLAEAGGQGKPVTARAALDGLGSRFEQVRREGPDALSGEWRKALIALLHSGEHGENTRRLLAELVPDGAERRLEKDTARRLFMTDRLSVSRLEQFAACPYRHFIEYGLRPVRQETFEYENSDAGTFFHAALDRYMKRAGADRDWPDFTPEQVDGYMDAICAELTEEWNDTPLRNDAIGEWTGEDYLRRVRRAAQVLTRFAANSDFRTIATEQVFGDAGGLPPVVIGLPDGSRATIRGQIDRIDTYENGEGVWLRIVDNKSREKKPDPARMATGEQLQLMIYLKAASDSIPDARLAGAMYFPVQDKEVETESDDPDRIEEVRLSTARMKGLVTDSEDVIRAMDRDIRPYSMDKVFNQDGTVSKSVSWVIGENTLHGLMDAAMEKAGELCGRMRDGEIEASPGEDNAGSVCRYCDYRAICRAGKEKGRARENGITYQEIARGKNTLRENEI